MMKKIGILLLLVCICAMNIRAQVRIDIEMGGGLVSSTYEEHDGSWSWRVGAGAELPVGSKVFVRPSLFFVHQTFESLGWMPDSREMHMNQLMVPVMFNYRLLIGRKLSVDWGIGGFVAFGLCGSAYDDECLRRVNAGPTFRGTLNVGHRLMIGAGFDWGLVNLDKKYDYSSKLSDFSVMVGFKL